MKLTPLTILALSASAPSLLAQRGPFQGIPHLISVSGTEVAWKKQGDYVAPNSQVVVPVPVAGQPNYSAAALFGAVASLVDVDAMSVGSDHIPHPGPNGELNPDPTGGIAGWLAFTFSVAPGSTRAESIMSTRPYVGADIYSMFLPGSSLDTGSGAPIELDDQLYLAQGYEHLGLTTSARVDAHDGYAPYIQAGNPPPELILNTTQFYFFFSVTHASSVSLNAARSSIGSPAEVWLQNVTNSSGSALIPVHEADIYRLDWNAASGWSKPTVFRQHADLGLSQESDVDALAVKMNASEYLQVVLVSTVGDNPRLKVQYITSGNGNGNVSNAVVPTDRFGHPIYIIDAGDIDGVSVWDPEGSAGSINNRLGFARIEKSLPPATLSLGIDNERPLRTALVTVSGFQATDAGAMNIWAITPGATWLVGQFPISGLTPYTCWSALLPINPTSAATEIDVLAQFVSNSGATKYSWVNRIRQ